MIYAIVAVLVLIADQAVKFWTTKNIVLSAIGEDCVELIPGVVHMTNVHNYGAAYGILQNARWPLVVVTLLFVVAIIMLISQERIHTKFGRWTAVLILAGAIGNCIDRILYGYVVDMFEFEFFTFPVFNVADIFITLSGILFCIHVVLYKEPEEVRKANETTFARRVREQKQAKRQEKAAKEAPYARIPKRGEHKSLEEELRPIDPNDPFAEWTSGSKAKPAEEKPKPAPESSASAPAEDEFDLRFNARYKPAREAAAAAEPVRRREPEPAPRPKTEKPLEPEEPERRRKPTPEAGEERRPDRASEPEERTPEPKRAPEPEERSAEPSRRRERIPETEPRPKARRKPEPEPEPERRPSRRREYDDYDDYDDRDDYDGDDYDDYGYDDRSDYDPSGDFSFDYDPSADFDFDTPAKQPEKKPERRLRPSSDIAKELDDILSEYGDF